LYFGRAFAMICRRTGRSSRWQVKHLTLSSFRKFDPFNMSLAQRIHLLPLQPRPQATEIELFMAARQGDRP
jgi:hypothetical protein